MPDEVTGTYDVVLDTTNTISVTAADGATVTASDVATAVDAHADYSASVDADGNVVIANTTGASMNVAETNAGNTGEGFTDADLGDLAGQISLDSTSDITFTGTGLTNAGLGDVGNATTTINLVDVSTRDGATTAITSIDSALSEIDEMRGEMGAVQNRFESTISNLQNVSENISAARSRIVDADFAAETAALTKSQILQQAGIAMLAQANQLPQAVLSLLQ
ncbi:MAG: hypothetical protein JRI62_10440 [Deltaproteobacteria bacterium]|nr:hypothetical protein [Deltaproteobacteria bacterium]